MTYRHGLTKEKYDERLNNFVRQFIRHMFDSSQLSFRSQAELSQALVKAIETDVDNMPAIHVFCAKHGFPEKALTQLLLLLKRGWKKELRNVCVLP